MVGMLIVLAVGCGAAIAGILVWAFVVCWLSELCSGGPYYTPTLRKAIREDREFTRRMRERCRQESVSW